MQINFKEMLRLVRLRMLQIDDASKEYETFNKEWRNLKDIESSLVKIIKEEHKRNF